MVCDEVVGGQEEAAGSAGGVGYHFSAFGAHTFDDSLDEGAGGEVLAGSAFNILGISFEETFVGIAFDIGGHREPVFISDKFDDESSKFGWVLDFVLGFAED